VRCEVEFVSNVYQEAGQQVIQCNVRDITVRKRAEEVHRESEERFHVLVEGVKDYAVFMLDAEGHTTSWNTGVERVLGYDEAEFVGQHFSCIFTPEDIATGEPGIELHTAETEGQVRPRAVARPQRWHTLLG